MTNYGGFINSMLQMREQNLREQLAAEELAAKQNASMMDSIGSGIDSAMKGFQNTMAQGKTDAIYNSLMNEKMGPPRALGVEGQAQWDSKLATEPGFYTGGKTQFDALMELQKVQNAGKNDSWNAQSRDMAVNRYNQTDPGSIAEEARRREAAAKEVATQNQKAIEDSNRETQRVNADITKISGQLNETDPKKQPSPAERITLQNQLSGLYNLAGQNQTSVMGTTVQPSLSYTDQKLLDQRDKALKASFGPNPQVSRDVPMQGSPSITQGWRGSSLSPQAEAFQKAQIAAQNSNLPPQMQPGGIPVPGQRPMPTTYEPQTYARPEPAPVSSTAPSTTTPSPNLPPRPGFKVQVNKVTGQQRYVPAVR